MRVFTAAILLATIALTSGCATHATPSPRSPVLAMATGAAIDPPSGYTDLCRREPELCATRPLAAPELVDDELLYALIQQVNRAVNGGVRQVSDERLFGGERWRRSGLGAGAVGDCEDLAIEKREMLLAAGVAPWRLFYAVAYRRNLGLHAVLVASTDRGDLILDSRTPYLRRWQDTAYTWVSRQSTLDPLAWTMVADVSASAAKSKSDHRLAVATRAATGPLRRN